MDLGGGRSLEAGGFRQEQFREVQTFLYFKDTMKRKYLDIQTQCHSKQRKRATETNAGRSLENTSSDFSREHSPRICEWHKPPEKAAASSPQVCSVQTTFPENAQAEGD